MPLQSNEHGAAHTAVFPSASHQRSIPLKPLQHRNAGAPNDESGPSAAGTTSESAKNLDGSTIHAPTSANVLPATIVSSLACENRPSAICPSTMWHNTNRQQLRPTSVIPKWGAT